MRRKPQGSIPAALAVAFLSLTAYRSCGADGRYLGWNDCTASGAPSSSLTDACASDGGSQSLIPSFRLSAPVDSVIAVEAIVDLQYSGFFLPDWWLLAPTGCRYGGLQAASVAPAHPPCVNMWDLSLTPGVAYAEGEPRGFANQARIFVGFALPSTAPPLMLRPAVYYTAGMIILRNSGTSACTGCGGGACLVLNSIRLGRVPLPSQPYRHYDVVTSTPADSNRVTWQGGADCGAVPVRSRTWGQLKALYR